MFYTILIGIISLSVLILIHEFGHFISARFLNVNVKEFGIGFGLTLLKKKWRGTLFKLNLIPLGGYCGFYEEEDSKIDSDKKEFNSYPTWRRLIIVTAGVIFNYFLGILLFVCCLIIGMNVTSFSNKILVSEKINLASGKIITSPGYSEGLRTGDKILEINNKKVTSWQEMNRAIITQGDSKKILLKIERDNNILNFNVKPMIDPDTGGTFIGIRPFLLNKINEVEKDSPAYNAGLKKEDVIIKINDKEVLFFSEIKKIILDNPNNLLTFDILRKNEKMQFKLTPIKANDMGYIGVNFAGESVNILKKSSNILFAVKDAFIMANESIMNICYGLKLTFTGKVNIKNALSGPVKIAYLTGKVAQEKNIASYLYFLAYISIALAFFNLLPIPAVDGSYILIYLYEMIFRQKLNEKIFAKIQYGAFIFLMILGTLIIFNDTWQLINIHKSSVDIPTMMA